jgi:hypothetical protein
VLLDFLLCARSVGPLFLAAAWSVLFAARVSVHLQHTFAIGLCGSKQPSEFSCSHLEPLRSSSEGAEVAQTSVERAAWKIARFTEDRQYSNASGHMKAKWSSSP